MNDTTTNQSWWTGRNATVVKLVLTLGVLALILAQIDRAALLRVMAWQVVLAIGIMQVVLLLSACLVSYRHAILITKPRAPLWPCFTALILSSGLNLVMPARLSELIKATYLRVQLNIPLSNGTAAIVIERLFDVCIVAAIGLIGFVGLYVSNPLPLIALLAAGIAGLVLLNPISRRLLPWFERQPGRFWQFVAGNCHHILTMLDLRMSLMVLLLTLGSWLLHYFGIWLFFAVQPGYALDAWQAAIVFGAIIFAGAIPALPGGIGIIQAAVTFALVQIGFSAAEAFVLSIALHLAEILISAIATPIILALRPTGLGHLMQDITQRPAKKALES